MSCIDLLEHGSSLFSFSFQLVPKLTRNFMKEGFMEKTGPKVCVVPAGQPFKVKRTKIVYLALWRCNLYVSYPLHLKVILLY